MDLRSKLAVSEAPRAASRQQEPAPAEREVSLEELRQRMARILASETTPARRTGAPNPAESTLPFIRESTEHGVLTIRTEPLARGYHVGRMPVSAGQSASAELLALLALDPGVAGVDPAKALYLDTETTGLGGGAGTLAFLVGLAFFDADGALRVEQLLLGSPAEERALLEYLRERVSAADCLVTFNGKSFDWPLLRGRFVMNRMEPPPERVHVDLLHIGRRIHKGRIESCTLKSLESHVLGFDRDGDIDGAEVAPRYSHYLRTGDEEALRAVVDHNLWDVLSMAALVGLYGEPLELLHTDDLLGLAATLKRAKAFDAAERAASRAVASGVGGRALELRAHIAKARGDKARALRDFESARAELDDPAIRLELAKLYEHYVKRPLDALAMVDAGTPEKPEAEQRRRERLQKKAARSAK